MNVTFVTIPMSLGHVQQSTIFDIGPPKTLKHRRLMTSPIPYLCTCRNKERKILLYFPYFIQYNEM